MLRVSDGFRFGLGVTLSGVVMLAVVLAALKAVERVDPDLVRFN